MPILAGTEAARRRAQAGGKAKHHSPLIQIIEMQDILRRGLSDPQTPLREAAQAACAWDKLEARKAILRGRPANTSQSIKSEPKQKKARNQGPVEPVEVVEPMRVSGPVHPTDTQPTGTTDARAQVKPLLSQAVSQPDCQPAKSTGAWAKAMGEPEALG